MVTGSDLHERFHQHNNRGVSELQASVAECPYGILQRLNLAQVYGREGYADLQAGEAYIASLLIDELEDGEYSEQVIEQNAGDIHFSMSEDVHNLLKVKVYRRVALEYLILGLIECGCLRSAYKYYETLKRIEEKGNEYKACKFIHDVVGKACDDKLSRVGSYKYLNDVGEVSREIYAWNKFEPDKDERYGEDTLKKLNSELGKVSNKLEVRVVELPVLTQGNEDQINRQLGVYAREDIYAGEIILRELSTVTASNTGLETEAGNFISETIPRSGSATGTNTDRNVTCEACCVPLCLARGGECRECGVDRSRLVRCGDCGRGFCSEVCHDVAKRDYHAAVCGDRGVEAYGCIVAAATAATSSSWLCIHDTSLSSPPLSSTTSVSGSGCDLKFGSPERILDQVESNEKTWLGQSTLIQVNSCVESREACESLYASLLLRCIAMSMTQRLHPLDLPCIKYLWGEFSSNAKLPWSFKWNILIPFNILERLNLNIFTMTANSSAYATITPPSPSQPIFSVWIFNTLYAKFRGVASARTTRIAAVHPFWCLVNHSCTPNVTWDWNCRSCQGMDNLTIPGNGGGGPMILQARFTKATKRKSQESKIARHGYHDELDNMRQTLETNTQNVAIRANEQILSHYCDINLNVQERREWLQGVLGGACKCDRCIQESRE